jgi:hypothetical protein
MNIENARKRLNELLNKGIGNLKSQELIEVKGINLELAKYLEEFL